MPDPTSPASGAGDPAKTGGSPPQGTPSESDVISLRKSLEAAVAQSKAHEATIAKHLADLDSERAVHKTVVAERDTLKAQLTEHQTKLADALKQAEQAAKTLLETRRSTLVSRYGLKPEQVKDFTEAQLQALESTLPTIAKPGLDSNGHGGSNTAGLSSREKILAGLKAGA